VRPTEKAGLSDSNAVNTVSKYTKKVTGKLYYKIQLKIYSTLHNNATS
jgi:hypothetical protein